MDSSSSLSEDGGIDMVAPDFQLDLRDLLEDEAAQFASPKKKRQKVSGEVPYILNGTVPFLPAPSSGNELFQVTNNMRNNNCKKDVFGLEEEDIYYEAQINNAKIEKLVNDLGLTQKDYELDDELRTRIYQGRFKKHEVMRADELDFKLNAFLDKENINMDPSKSKTNDKIKKSSKVFFQAPRRPTNKSQIPVLRPLSNLTNFDMNKPHDKILRSPNRICAPKKTIEAGRSCLKNQKELIYIVELLTGLVNDATQFATELNSSNCEGFPLPENISEVVQIPTNEETGPAKKKPKMALIRGLTHTQTAAKKDNKDHSLGFYTRNQFDAYRLQVSTPSSGVEVETQVKSPKPKRVLWAPDLVW